MTTLFVCDICGFTNSDKESIERCEKGHAKIEELKIEEINWKSKSGNGFPDTITIRFKDVYHSYKF